MIELGLDLIKIMNIFASHPPYNSKIKIDPHDLIKGKKIFEVGEVAVNQIKILRKYLTVLIKRIYTQQTLNLKFTQSIISIKQLMI